MRGKPVHSKYWQGTDISQRLEAEMFECLNVSFQSPMVGWSLERLQKAIKPNLPWADLHFEQERVGGQPLNPGETWKIWPWGNSADKFRKEGEQFNHTYAERFWPKFAGLTIRGKWPGDFIYPRAMNEPVAGIRHVYADLNDVINQLIADPLTRQAYIPIWFPEDGSHTDRKPCTLGYHVIRRGEYFHIVYYIRSCDIIRHFADDVYLAVRLLFWLLDQLKQRDQGVWQGVVPGMFIMHITSLHCFQGDRIALSKMVAGA